MFGSKKDKTERMEDNSTTTETSENEETLNSGAELESASPDAELAEKDRLLEEAADKYKRLLAEFDNFRKRTLKEKENIRLHTTELIVLELLPVIDNFERALKNVTPETAQASGVEMIFRQFNAVLANLGVEPIPTEGCQFDPAWHEALGRIENSGEPEGAILAEIQKGYKINERIIRASRVQVAG